MKLTLAFTETAFVSTAAALLFGRRMFLVTAAAFDADVRRGCGPRQLRRGNAGASLH